MTKRERIETISDVANRAIAHLAKMGITQDKLSVMMDLEYVDEVCPIDFDRLLAFDDGNFGHDINGIYQNWNRQTKELENCFCPRAAKPEAYNQDDEPGPGDALGIEVRVVEREVGYDIVVEFNAHIETYHYDQDTPVENGKYFAVENFTGSYPDLFTIEAVAIALGTTPVAKPIGPTTGEQFDRSRAVNLYLMAARDLGTNLGGYDLVDLLADKTDWDLDKCRRLAKYVVTENSVIELLTSEGVPKDIDPPGVKRGRKPYAGTQFESDDDEPDLTRETDYYGSHALKPKDGG